MIEIIPWKASKNKSQNSNQPNIKWWNFKKNTKKPHESTDQTCDSSYEINIIHKIQTEIIINHNSQPI